MLTKSCGARAPLEFLWRKVMHDLHSKVSGLESEKVAPAIEEAKK